MILDKKSQPPVTESSVNVYSIHNRNKIIILSLVGFFASQKLYFKTLYQIDFPFGMDFPNGINYIFTYVKTGFFPFAEFLPVFFPLREPASLEITELVSEVLYQTPTIRE